MRIDPSESGNVQEACGDYLSVGDDDDSVGTGFAQELFGFGSADFFGLKDGEAGCEGGFFYGGEGNFVAAAAGAVRLGDDGEDFEVWLGEEMPQCRDGELWGAAKEEAQWISPGWIIR